MNVKLTQTSAIILAWLMSSSPAAPSTGSPVLDNIWNYREDSGELYGARGNGLTYGWSADMRHKTVDRNASLSPDERYDRSIALDDGAKWEMAVPSGYYRVLVVAGDATVTDAYYKIAAEGTIVVDGAPDPAYPWVSGIAQVQVTDGRLTITSAPGARNNRLAYLEVLSPIDGHFPEPTYASLPLYVNVGGRAAGDFLADRVWSENGDYGYRVKGDGFTLGTSVGTYGAPIEGAAPIAGLSASIAVQREGDFSYRVRVRPGTYHVYLHFAELRIAKTGRRLIDVSAEGTLLASFDLYVAAGGLGKAYVVKAEVPVKDGFLDIDLVSRNHYFDPVLNALVVSEGPVSASASEGAGGTVRSPLRVSTRAGEIFVHNAGGRERYCLRSMAGRVILRGRLGPRGGTQAIAARRLPAGLYILDIESHQAHPRMMKIRLP